MIAVPSKEAVRIPNDALHQQGGNKSIAGDRLDSWKEIAAYLNREVRTVQRWEKREGLPVHRQIHEKLGTVYAYESEIDAWWRARSGNAARSSVRTAERSPP